MARAPVSKFYERCLWTSSSIPERPALSAHFECPSVPHPFLSRTVPSCSVAISVATDLSCSRTSERVQLAQLIWLCSRAMPSNVDGKGLCWGLPTVQTKIGSCMVRTR
jgi:hypothetical protein